MTIKKIKSGWQVDFRPEGRKGKRVRETFIRKRDAEEFVISEKSKAQAGLYKRAAKDSRSLQELIDDWFDMHGYTLKDGEKRKLMLDRCCERLGNPKAIKLTGEQFIRYRKERLSMKSRLGKPISINTVNHEQAYLAAVFGHLIKLKNWEHDNPLKGLPKLKMDEPELTFLDVKQISSLLTALEKSKNKDALIITKICLATGARWGEAESLHARNVSGGKIHLVGTKNSRTRSMPISGELEKEIKLGRPTTGRLFKSSWYAFKGAIDRAGIDLPDGQQSHVLRHTFASHYMMNGGNILLLQKALDHSSLTMTMRYAKMAPEHLADIVDKNPLARL